MKFEIPYFTTSGIQVRYLKIVEKSGYQGLPWVRYITQTVSRNTFNMQFPISDHFQGEYEVRLPEATHS